MKPLFRSIASVVFAACVLAGCTTLADEPKASWTDPEPAKLNQAKPLFGSDGQTTQPSSAKVGELILVWVAGYCEGWTKATGEDFERCVNTTVDFTMKQYEENMSAAADAK
ncbi:hypothetical protein [Pseudomonas amygdali]|uniref:Lipoprotein n=1 Tax=Pseudomonas amygdali pv. lachrymans str. M301315 TaxID=629260 RepID=A0AAD0PVQ6_PSEAV|nr:hypothetical protein [Pseudomonas amygdali]AXH59639.1 hypothetical protein PLA107_030920 [Pseudomonas amygdali pv. lachrymans str. M301315]RMT06312.1 hypothetical protein ALP54_03556 [Pseudomonas amygdali pv. lachrymans]